MDLQVVPEAAVAGGRSAGGWGAISARGERVRHAAGHRLRRPLAQCSGARLGVAASGALDEVLAARG